MPSEPGQDGGSREGHGSGCPGAPCTGQTPEGHHRLPTVAIFNPHRTRTSPERLWAPLEPKEGLRASQTTRELDRGVGAPPDQRPPVPHGLQLSGAQWGPARTQGPAAPMSLLWLVAWEGLGQSLFPASAGQEAGVSTLVPVSRALYSRQGLAGGAQTHCSLQPLRPSARHGRARPCPLQPEPGRVNIALYSPAEGPSPSDMLGAAVACGDAQGPGRRLSLMGLRLQQLCVQSPPRQRPALVSLATPMLGWADKEPCQGATPLVDKSGHSLPTGPPRKPGNMV